MVYDFTLKYQLADNSDDMNALVEQLGAVGCDDALVGIGQPGRLALEFSRESDSAENAVGSALRDVKKAIPHARLVEASPDFVGLTDVAEMVGISRQAMRKLMTKYWSTFPAPVHEGSTSIWHLAEVLGWLEDRGGYRVDRSVLAVARVTLEANLAKESNRHLAKAHRQMEHLTA